MPFESSNSAITADRSAKAFSTILELCSLPKFQSHSNKASAMMNALTYKGFVIGNNLGKQKLSSRQ